MTSIRARLTLGLVTAVLVITVVVGTLLQASVHKRLSEDFDTELQAKTRAMAAMVRRDDKGIVEVDFAKDVQHEFSDGEHPQYFEVFDTDGHEVERSPSLKGKTLGFRGPGTATLTLPDARVGRVTAFTFLPKIEEEDERRGVVKATPVTLVVARGIEPVTRMLHLIGWRLAGAGVALAACAAAAVWALVGRGLRPMAQLADQAVAIDANRLSTRFATQVPSELQPIVTRLNDLLARLEAAFARERRFTAAAAHELRTPIAELRTMAEVAIRWPHEAANNGQGMPEVLEVAQHMEALAGSLLALSRCESGQEIARREPVDLAAVAARAATSERARAWCDN